MASFTRLDDNDVAAIAAAMNLGAVASWRSLPAGTINSNFLVTTDRGRFFVRVNEGKTRADVQWECDLLEHLARHQIPTPRALPNPKGGSFLDHQGLLVCVFTWLPGRHRAENEVTLACVRTLGATLAEFHRAALTRPESTWRDGIYQFSDIVRRFEGFRDSADPQLSGAIAMLADELAWLGRQASVRAGASRGLIHGDLFRDNVLWEGERLVALLDFEQASGGSHAYDLAVAFNDWCWNDGFCRDRAQALFEGYTSQRGLSASDRAALPMEIRAAAARFTITRITDVYLRQVDNPEKDFRAFLARLKVWREVSLDDVFSSV